MLKINNNIIINADNENERKLALKQTKIIITCGLKYNSTVTASSINDDGFTFCIQRSFNSISNKTITPQEFNVHWENKENDIDFALEFVTALLLCNISPEEINKIQF